MKLTYEQIQELLPAYVLGALESDEMLAVDGYITEHQELLAQLNRAEEAIAQMAHGAPDVPVPIDAKTKLMDRVYADLAAPSPASTPDQPTWLTRLWSYFVPANGWAVATACALLLLVVVGIYVMQMQRQVEQVAQEVNTLRDEVAQLQTQNQELQQMNQILDRQLQNNQNYLALIANIDTEQTIRIPGTEEAPNASGTFFVSQSGQGLLVLQGLDPLPDQQTYQLWLIPPDADPHPAGLVAVNPDAPTWFEVEISPEVQDFTAVGLSIEPAGGSPAPTGPIVMLGSKS
jgi:anti-sigma-K factor RskA